MRKKHGWDTLRARRVVQDFQLRKKREFVPQKSSNSKYMKCDDKWLCSFQDCRVEVSKMCNHLKQKHRLKGEHFIQAKKDAKRILHDNTFYSESSASTYSTSEDEARYISFANVNHPPLHCDEEHDKDWFVDHYLREKCENTRWNGKEVKSDSSLHHDVHLQIDSSQANEEDDLKSFGSWLQSIDGGNRNERTANKHINTLMGIIRFHDNTNLHVNNLQKQDFLSSWVDHCLNRKPKPMESGTIKTYLNSVRLYLDYFLLKKNATREVASNINKLKLQFKLWNKRLYKGLKIRKHVKARLDIQRFPTVDEMKLLDKSSTVKEALDYLNYLRCGECDPSKSGFTLIRDYILCTMLCDNCSRPGGVYNMNLGEVKNACPDKYKTGYDIEVFHHKTSEDGPVNVSVSNEMYAVVCEYINHARNKLWGVSTKDTDPVFITYAGDQMGGNLLDKQLKSFWKKSTGKQSTINATILRKYTTSLVHENCPDFKKDLADHLNHSQKTADEHYDLVDKRKKAVSISSRIRDIQRGISSSEDEKDAWASLYEEEINEGKISSHQIDMKLHLLIQRLPHFKSNDKERKRVLDGVRNLIHTNIFNDPQLMKESHSESTACEHTKFSLHVPNKDDNNLKAYTKRIRKVYSDAENAIIKNNLANYIYSDRQIIRQDFEREVRTIPELNSIVGKFTINSLIVKVRTERKNVAVKHI